MINLEKRTVIPGLNDSHTHVIRGGLHSNLELRWEGIPSLRRPVFRMLWIATLVSSIGTWMHDIGAGWLMTSLAPSPSWSP